MVEASGGTVTAGHASSSIPSLRQRNVKTGKPSKGAEVGEKIVSLEAVVDEVAKAKTKLNAV